MLDTIAEEAFGDLVPLLVLSYSNDSFLLRYSRIHVSLLIEKALIDGRSRLWLNGKIAPMSLVEGERRRC